LVFIGAWSGAGSTPAAPVEVLSSPRRLLPTSAWTVIRRKWLGEQRFEHTAEQITFDTYLHTVDLVDRRIEQLERAIRETAEQGPWRELVARLRCLRGIDTLTALTLVAEIGDFGRFRTAEEFMAFVGLVPSAHSSGEQRRQGSITKVRQQPRSPTLGRVRLARPPTAEGRLRARPPPPRPRRRGDRTRLALPATLHQCWQRMAGRGKPHQKIVVACARELAGFVWAIATDQPSVPPDHHSPLASSSGCVQPHGEPSQPLMRRQAPAGDPRP
jgi:transposase